MLKNLVKTTVLILMLVTTRKALYAQEKPVNIHLFWTKGCPHCAKEKEYLETLAQKDLTLKIHTYEVSQDKSAAEVFKKVGGALSADISGVPFTVIGNKYFMGFAKNPVFEKKIKDLISKTREENLPDVVEMIKNERILPETPQNAVDTPHLETIKLPIIGTKVDLKNASLPIITFVLALADGFNPCAMWVLLFLISLLLGIEDRKKMWLLGGTFIFASGVVYFLVLAAWLNLFLFFSYIPWIRIIIGFVALYAGYTYIKEYYTNKDGGCKVVGNNEKRIKTFNKLKSFVTEKNLLISLGGIALLAFAVNIVEFVCSAGLPAVYTNILSLNNLPRWQYYLYIAFYVVVFMIDDLIIFTIAMVTLKAVGIESKYARTAHFIGGVLMLTLGAVIILKPELLMLG